MARTQLKEVKDFLNAPVVWSAAGRVRGCGWRDFPYLNPAPKESRPLQSGHKKGSPLMSIGASFYRLNQSGDHIKARCRA